MPRGLRRPGQEHEVALDLVAGDQAVRFGRLTQGQGAVELSDPATTPLHAVYPPGPYTAPKVRAMIEFLTARFGAETEWEGHSDMARGA